MRDLTPRFLDFYDAALAERADPERRWALWQERYGFAAVPPGPEGRAMARRLLDEAWPKYPAVVDRLRGGTATLAAEAQATVDRIAPLLGLPRPLTVQLLLYVGGLEPNAFTAAMDGRTIVALPVEEDPATRPLTMAHELTHAVHLATAGLPGGWERSIAQTVVTEGLAMRVVERLFPERDAREHAELTPGWLEQAAARRRAVLEGIRPHLAASDGETVARFTIGTGAAGLEREAYYAGWLVVGRLLAEGRSFAELAAIPADRLPALVDETIAALLAEP